MTHIKINIDYSTDRRPDATDVFDFVVFSMVLLSLIWLAFVAFCIIIFRKKSVMRAQKPHFLLIMVAGAFIHVSSAFISDGHFISIPSVYDAMTFHCTIFDFWLQYGIGFNMFFFGLTARLLTWFLILNNIIVSDNSKISQKRTIVRITTPAVFCTCIVVLCFFVEIFRASQVQEEYGWCLSSIIFKIFLIILLLVCWGTILSILFILSKHKEKRMISYYETRDAIIIWSFFFMLLMLVNMSGVLSFWWGRSITTLSIAFMYSFFFARLLGHPLLRIFRKTTDQGEAYNLFCEMEEEVLDIDNIEQMDLVRKMYITESEKMKNVVGPDDLDSDNPLVYEEEKNIKETKTKDKLNVLFRTRVIATNFILVEPPYKLLETGQHMYIPKKVISLFYSCTDILLKESSDHSNAILLFSDMRDQHFYVSNPPGIESIIQNEYQTEHDSIENQKVHISLQDDRITHTIPLSLQRITDMYLSKIDVILVHRIRSFCRALILKFWFCAFRDDSQTKTIILDYYEKSGKGLQAILQDGMVEHSILTAYRETITHQDITDQFDPNDTSTWPEVFILPSLKK